MVCYTDSIALGGGSVIDFDRSQCEIGPVSVGHRLNKESLVFAGETLTATDIAVRLGRANIGDKDRVSHLEDTLVQTAAEKIAKKVERVIDELKSSVEVSDRSSTIDRLHPKRLVVCSWCV